MAASSDDILLDAEERMEAAVHAMQEKAKGIRTGRATPELVEPLRVDYYGALTPLKQVASIQIPDASLIVIKPFDASLLKEIERAINAANLGMTPQNDGKLIRLPMPPLSQERRRQYADMVKVMAEDARVSLRNIRRDAKKNADDAKKAGLPEDDAERLHESIQKLTDDYGAKIEALLKKKSDELLNG